ncbi:class I adenylate-forming enzyme family protein [Spirillospora sp. NPDC047279]|uniref:class I adenylate-forming enzyme family protein n=1 Tax=Spirillospora sp. NPDC047279 TaxID=3155478 RepID=UPI00340F9A0C
MTGTAGRLTVDGAEIPARLLRAVVDETTRGLAACSAGPGRAVAVDPAGGTVIVVAALAAARVGAPLVLCPRRGRGPGSGAVALLSATNPVDVLVRPCTPDPDHLLPDDAAAVFWTSGSSGSAKAVVLSRAALDYQSSATRDRLGLTAGDTLALPLPLSHAYGFSVLGMWQRFGPGMHLLTTPHLGPTLAALHDRATTSLDGVPSFYAMMLRRARQDEKVRRRLRELRFRNCGGAVLPAALATGFRSVVGADLYDGYGLTEAGPNVAISAPGACRPGSVGPALAGTDVRIAADGEIQVRGPGVMTGYHADPEADAAAFTRDGWLRTGDLGALDDGYLYVRGRAKEVIIVLGETFAPADVEDVLCRHEGVGDAAVVGLPGADARGDTVVAFVEPSEGGAAATPDDLRTTCRRNLPPALRPRVVHLVRELPRLSNGKLDRRRVRRLAESLRR